jgi:hypothetical protein
MCHYVNVWGFGERKGGSTVKNKSVSLGVLACLASLAFAATSCSVEDLNQIGDCADAASLQIDALQAEQLGRSDAAAIRARANRASEQCDDSVNANLNSEYGPSGTSRSGSGSSGGINTDRSNGVCNYERFMQDPDC